MKILPINNINYNKQANSVNFNGIIRPKKFLQTKGSFMTRLRVLVIDTKRNYCVKDFENNGVIKNSPILSNPIARTVFDFFELKLKNVHKVSSKYYRGAVLTCEYDILRLKRQGVTDIINLLEPQKQNPKLADFARKQGINYHYIELPPPYGIPTESQIKKFFEIIKNSKGMVYTHCLQGKDRTGLMTFMYETEVLKTTVNKAAKNMIDYGMHVARNPKMIDFLADRYPDLIINSLHD